MTWYVPTTPAGTPVIHIKAKTKEKTIKNLLRDAAHMPYKTWENFEERGYTIAEYPDEALDG